MYVCDRSSWASAARSTAPVSSQSQPTDAITRSTNIAAVQEDIPARGTWGAAHTREGPWLPWKHAPSAKGAAVQAACFP